VLNVSGSRHPVPPMSASWDAPDDHPLIDAYGWLQSWWEEATIVPVPAFAVDDLVVLSNSHEEGHVRRSYFDAGAWQYSVRVGTRTLTTVERDLSRPVLVDDPYEWIRQPGAAGPRLAATLTRAKLSRRLNDTL
jgi:hypothetical protein